MTDGEIETLFAVLAGPDHPRRAALAVSGGADSMALMFLAARWRQIGPADRTELSIVTVDHGLRAESASEARFVGEHARRLGFLHVTLAWTSPKPRTGLQAAARAARYRLISEHAARAGLDAVVTAHTMDDQAETLLMRLARGSGVDGLAAMVPDGAVAGLRVLRPLLAVPRSRLAATLTSAGVAGIEDPSNDDMRYERVRIRRARASLEAIGLAAPALARSARRLARAKAALDHQAAMLLERSEALTVLPAGCVEIDWRYFRREPAEIRLRALADLLRAVGGSNAPFRLEALEELADAASDEPPAGRTLARCQFVRRKGDRVLLMRERGRTPLPELELQPGAAALWDGRFDVVLGSQAPSAMLVSEAGADGVRRLRAEDRMPAGVPAGAVRAVPAFRDGARLVAIPSLGWLADGLPCSGTWRGWRSAEAQAER